MNVREVVSLLPATGFHYRLDAIVDSDEDVGLVGRTLSR